jgi:tetratricopeptide (TPR) repeat protein
MRFRCKHFLSAYKFNIMFKKQPHKSYYRHGKLFFLIHLACLMPAIALAGTQKSVEKPKDDTVARPVFQSGMAGAYLASQFAHDEGDVDAAIRYLTSTLAKNPSNSSLASQLLGMQVIKGDMNAALANAKKIVASGQHDALADLLFVTEMVKRGDYADASHKLTEAFDYANGQLWLPLVDAWLDAGNKNIKQPITLEEMPVTVGRAASVINYHLALINAYAGFNEQASANFIDAVEEPETAPMRIMQQLAAFSSRHPELTSLKDVVSKYTLAHREGPPPLESTIRNPQDGVAEVLYTMGNVMQMAGVRQDAMVYLQLARYLRPDFNLASFALAEILTESKAYKRANDLLANIPRESLYAMKASLRQALILDRMGRTPEALDILAQLAARNPKAADPWIAKGDLLRVHDRFLEATIAYSEAIERTPQPTVKDWPMFYARGACHERLNRWSEAKADLQKSLELSPNQPDVLNYLGYGMIVRGEAVADAKSILERALAANPNDPQIIDSMGWALYTLGEYKNALPYLERAVELLASDATVNDHLGDIYWRLGRKIEARYQWERALTYKPDESEIKKINAKLAAGLPDMPLVGTKSAAAGNPVASTTP